MNITVIIPTYRRPQDLTRCLEALKQQNRPADRVLVVVRDIDFDTWNLLKTLDIQPLPLQVVTVTIPGVVAALNAALDIAQGDIITITDDDAAPHPDWLERIEQHYLSDECIGAVGGRDWVYLGTELHDGNSEKVGIVEWQGRVIGNHHIGVGNAREVDILKGVNMSFRQLPLSKIRFDSRMRGSGAQVHFEMALCLALKQQGWKIIYDPTIAVDHFPAQRFDEDKRDRSNQLAVENAVHNETLVLLTYLPWVKRIIFLIWSVFVGTQDSFGFVQWLRFLPKQGKLAGHMLLVSLRGRWQGFQTWQQSSPQTCQEPSLEG